MDKTYFKDKNGHIFRMNRDEAARSGYTEVDMEAEKSYQLPEDFSVDQGARSRRTAREKAMSQADNKAVPMAKAENK
jgi:hypothetical protein